MVTLLIVITFVSVSLAVTMAAIAWRAIRRERRRSAARVAILAAEIADEEIQTPAASVLGASGLADGIDLFTKERSTLRSRTPIAVAASSVFVGTVIVVAVAVSQTDRATAMLHPAEASSASSPVASAEPPTEAGAPIELVSLTHEQSGTQLTIRGVVRNPAGGLARPHLTAVVLLFNRTGVFAGTGRAEVDTTDLQPDAEAHFSVSVPHVSDIGRYRVSFSTEDHVLPHVDKRHGA